MTIGNMVLVQKKYIGLVTLLNFSRLIKMRYMYIYIIICNMVYGDSVSFRNSVMTRPIGT